MSRTLIIPDVHNRTVQAQILIDNVPCDRIILTGDYFDFWNDNPDVARNTALWLKEFVLNNPKITALMGNHCQSYRWPFNPYTRCSGYSELKKQSIYSVLNNEDFDKLKIFTVDQGFVLSHAGLTNSIWKEYRKFNDIESGPTSLDAFVPALQDLVDRNIHMVSLFRNPPLFAPGWTRGGSQKDGGITWQDWSDFTPINGINQIVGHSIHDLPQILVQKKLGTIKTFSAVTILREKHDPFDDATSINYDLDTSSNHYAIIEDGKVTIYDTATRRTVKKLLEESDRNLNIDQGKLFDLAVELEDAV